MKKLNVITMKLVCGNKRLELCCSALAFQFSTVKNSFFLFSLVLSKL